MFNVICLETSEPIRADTGDGPMIFDNGSAAALHARALTETTGKKHQPRPCKDDNWQARELARLGDGTYQRVPWDRGEDAMDVDYDWWTDARKSEAAQHFAHVSKSHPGCIAYTQDAAKGAADIQTPIKPGRYLKQFYNLREAALREYANLFVAQYGAIQLQFATTPDDIERVYLNGPQSCMSKEARHYRSSVHPVRVYGAGDLSLAYLVNDDSGESNITARVLCWPAKMVFGRIYGDADKLQHMLEALGYSDGEFTRAKLLKIIDDRNGRIVCPYIDGNDKTVDDCGSYLRIGGDLSAERQDGYCEQSGTPCGRCGDRFDNENEGRYVEDHVETWCDSCCSDNTWHCDSTGETYSNDTAHYEMDGGTTWSEHTFARHGFHCDGTGTNYDSRRHDCVVMSGTCEGECWHTEHFADNGFTCDDCGDCFSNDDKHDIENADCADNTCLDCAGRAGLKDADDVSEAKTTARLFKPGRDESPEQIEMPDMPRGCSCGCENKPTIDILYARAMRERETV